MRRGGGRARGRRGRPGSRRAAGAARPGGVRGGRARGGRGGLASGRARPARGAQRLCSVLQVYPEPRSEGECLSNIREFLRGCGASLRLEVRPARGGRAGGARGERGVGAATSPASRPPRRGGGSVAAVPVTGARPSGAPSGSVVPASLPCGCSEDALPGSRSPGRCRAEPGEGERAPPPPRRAPVSLGCRSAGSRSHWTFRLDGDLRLGEPSGRRCRSHVA